MIVLRSMFWVNAAGLLLALGILAWLRTRLEYRITKTRIEILLFGIKIRSVKFTNIQHVTTHHVRWAEQWWNTWRPFRRRLMIQRRRGLIKNLVITPMYRYEFKADLERAIQLAQPPPGEPQASSALTGQNGSPA